MSIEDRAQEVELADWRHNNRPRELKTYAPDDPGYGPEFCDWCEDDMPDVRRAYGYRFCTPCAADRERRMSGGFA